MRQSRLHALMHDQSVEKQRVLCSVQCVVPGLVTCTAVGPPGSWCSMCCGACYVIQFIWCAWQQATTCHPKSSGAVRKQACLQCALPAQGTVHSCDKTHPVTVSLARP